MLINGVLNVAIGLALTFGVVSLVTSAITEALGSVLSLRSKTLLAGIKQLLNDPNATGLALAVYQHGTVNPMGSGAVPGAGWAATQGSYAAMRDLLGGRMPSYIAAKGFASALLDAVQNRQQPGGVTADLKTDIDRITDPQLRAVLQGFYARAYGDAEVLHQNVANWFDHAMARVSGDYKRWSQWVGLLTAAVLSVLLDVDAVGIARRMYVDPALLQHVAINPTDGPMEAFRTWSQTFPFGWDTFPDRADPRFLAALASTVFGWFLTTIATLFGAPFWFDVLQRFVQIRGAGPDADARRART